MDDHWSRFLKNNITQFTSYNDNNDFMIMLMTFILHNNIKIIMKFNDINYIFMTMVND